MGGTCRNLGQADLKLLKSAHLGSSQKSAAAGLLTQQKSATLQKVDLVSMAGKLQLLNQPANPAPS